MLAKCKSFLSKPLIFSHHILWFGLVTIAIVVFFIANRQRTNTFNQRISSQKAYCQEQQQNRLQRFSQFNDELMNYAIGTRSSTDLISTRQYLSHRNILRFILLSGKQSYSIKKHWYKESLLADQSIAKLHIKDLMFWLNKQVYFLDIQHPMYFLDSPFKNMLVVVPLTIPPRTTNPTNKEIAIFEIEKEALAIAMGESKICPYGIWNHKGQALFQSNFNHFPILLASQPDVKGEIWINERRDLILFEQHPSSIVIAHKLSLQDLYQDQKTHFKNTLFTLGVLCLFWCITTVFMSISISRPLKRFRHSLVQLSKGNFQSIPRLLLKGELGQMEKTIVEMSETLQKQRKKTNPSPHRKL